MEDQRGGSITKCKRKNRGRIRGGSIRKWKRENRGRIKWRRKCQKIQEKY